MKNDTVFIGNETAKTEIISNLNDTLFSNNTKQNWIQCFIRLLFVATNLNKLKEVKNDRYGTTLSNKGEERKRRRKELKCVSIWIKRLVTFCGHWRCDICRKALSLAEKKEAQKKEMFFWILYDISKVFSMFAFACVCVWGYSMRKKTFHKWWWVVSLQCFKLNWKHFKCVYKRHEYCFR